jgi:uncharacterized protein
MIFSRKNSVWVLLIFLVITGIQIAFVPRVKFNYDFDQFFPADHEETIFFESFKAKYGSDNDFLILAFAEPDGMFNAPFLRKIEEVTRFLEQHTDVIAVNSPMNSERIIRDPFSGAMFKKPLLTATDSTDFEFDSTFIYKNLDAFGGLFGKAGNSLRIIVQHKEKLNENDAEKLLEDIRLKCKDYELEPHLGGRIVGHVYYIRMSQNELILFIGSSVGLIVLFLILSFRSVIGVLIPALVVAGSVLWTIGLMGQFGVDLNIVLNVLPTVLMVVGISGVVHLFAHYFDELRNGLTKTDALKKAFYDVRIALVFTNLTTIVGFLTLTTSSIMPIIQFGFFSAVGVLFSFLLSMTVMPAMLTLFKPPKISEKIKQKQNWEVPLERIYSRAIQFRLGWLIFFVIVAIVSVIGLFFIRANNYILEDLKADHPMKIDYQFIEDEFGGARPLNFEITLKDTSDSFFDKQVLEEIEEAENQLATIFKAGHLYSPVFVVKNAYMAQKAGNPYYFSIPESNKDLFKIKREFDRFVSDSLKRGIFAADEHSARLTGMMGDVGSYASGEMNVAWENWLNRRPENSKTSFHQTGGPYLMEINNKLLVSNIIQGLAIAIGIIALIIGFMFRSFKIVLISLAPNVLPLIMIGAIMGYAGIDMKVSTSLVFTIAFGIAVDDTIHFLSKYRQLILHGHAPRAAIRLAYITTGKAIIITSIVLSGGFLTLCFSSFMGTFYIGFLTGMTLLFAVLTDLTLLPILLYIFQPEVKTKNKPLV